MTEKLTLKPTVNDDWDSSESTSILIGNSGLEFIRHYDNDEELYMHFTPDGNCGHSVDEITALKYSKLFCAAFYEFMISWIDEDSFPLQPRPRYVVGFTNARMFNFRENLFNREEYIFETVGGYDGSHDYCIDMEKAACNQKLIDRLKRIHARCLKEAYLIG